MRHLFYLLYDFYWEPVQNGQKYLNNHKFLGFGTPSYYLPIFGFT